MRFGYLVLFPLAIFAKPVDFQRDIRPILSDNCFQCHGPDPAHRMAGLRLDQKEAALEKRKNGTAVVPSNTGASLLYQRMIDANPARRMPPQYSHKSVSPDQAALVKQWIDEGARWSGHWAYEAPRKLAALPAVKDKKWATGKSAIDTLILAKLESKGLTPAVQADKRTLVRRVALDLTGLPPTPGEVDAFLADAAANAYERMVDRYLASPGYGEHRARYWLDAARYADTHGMHVDSYRELWPYRDWVIQAFNRNYPFDKFTVDQLAGDLIPDATLDQRIATGFHRCNATTNESGVINDEYAEIYAKDRADTTGAVWLGLTVGCAACHDHKFDPITSRDFYALGAFFRNTTQGMTDGNLPDTPPVMAVPLAADRDRWFSTVPMLTNVRRKMDSVGTSAALPASYTLPDGAGVLEPEALWFAADLPAAEIAAQGGTHAGDGPDGKALFFDTNAGIRLSGAPELDVGKPFSIVVEFFHPKNERLYTIAKHVDQNRREAGWILDVGGRVPRFHLRSESGRAAEIRSNHEFTVKPGQWNQITITYDGSGHERGLGMYLNGAEIVTGRTVNLEPLLLGGIGSRTPVLAGIDMESGAIADFRIYNRRATDSEALLLSQWSAVRRGDRNALLSYWLHTGQPEFRELAREEDLLKAERRVIARASSVTPVMHEKDSLPFASVLYRGAYTEKRERVEASTPGVLPPMDPALPRNRLGFAQWLVAPGHPLTARVTVNRMWQELFGIGLVKTVDDFGSQGEPPVNPELLDWLAVDFQENGWDVKRFYRQILLSNTYRQSALITPVKLARDPENRLLSRGARFRMDGEMVRDYALAASGLLTATVGGPSVKPYQPDGLWEAVAMAGSNTGSYRRDTGQNLYRRSLYTFWKRAAPPASMEIFNAPAREVCTVRRERTNTPLQALVTMNDVQFVEAARNLAEAAYKSAATHQARLDFMSLRVLARLLTAEEKGILDGAYEASLAHYQSHPADSAKLLHVGEKPADASLSAPEFAALTMLANQLLNLDEVLTK